MKSSGRDELGSQVLLWWLLARSWPERNKALGGTCRPWWKGGSASLVCIICCLITSTFILTVLSRLEQLGTLFQDKEAIPFYWFGSFGPELTQQLWPLQTGHFQQTSWNCAFSLPINCIKITQTDTILEVLQQKTFLQKLLYRQQSRWVILVLQRWWSSSPFSWPKRRGDYGLIAFLKPISPPHTRALIMSQSVPHMVSDVSGTIWGPFVNCCTMRMAVIWSKENKNRQN